MAPLVRSSASALAAWVFLIPGAPAVAQNAPPITLPPNHVFDPADDPYYSDDAYAETDMQDEFAWSGIETDTAAVREAHARLLQDNELQLTRPEQEMVDIEPVDPPGWVEALGQFLESLGPVFMVVFWTAVALVVLGLVYFLFGEAIRMRLGIGNKKPEKPADDVLIDIRPDADRARSLLEEADALAREGRFAEAVHLLLFRSIEDVQERLEGGVPTSLTSREIAGLGSMPDRARRALKPIIQVVEHSFFGGRDVDVDGWQSARRSYEDFAFGEGWA